MSTCTALPSRLATIRRHGLDDHGDVLGGVPGDSLRLDEVGGVEGRRRGGLGGGERLDALEPVCVRRRRRSLARELRVLLRQEDAPPKAHHDKQFLKKNLTQ